MQKFVQPDFNVSTWDNNIAMLKFEPFDFSSTTEIHTALYHPTKKAICHDVTLALVSTLCFFHFFRLFVIFLFDR